MGRRDQRAESGVWEVWKISSVLKNREIGVEMGRFELETSDYEILRTMARLHFLTSAEVIGTFFTSEFAGYRRLRKLAGLNLVKRHTKGAPPRSNYCAWRLSGAGIEAV